MRSFVFTDAALERHAGRFAWLSIDAEKEQNAGFLAKYPIKAFPTMFVIDPTKERATLRWVGGATVTQLTSLLDDSDRAWRRRGRGSDAALAKADRLSAEGKDDEAARAYRKVIDRASPGWAGRDRAVESLLTALGMSGKDAECVDLATRELPAQRTAHFVNVAASGLGCALSIENAKEPVARFETAVLSALSDPPVPMSGDDRSGLYGLLHGAREAAGDEPGAKRVAGEWLDFLEREAAAATNPAARAVFDSHRLGAAMALGEPQRAVAALTQSEKDFPQDFNPPARLAIAYRELGQLDDALAAIDRALTLAYGPRKIRVYSTRADILEKKGDAAGARATVDDALKYAEGLPKSQVSPRTIEGLRKRLATLTAGAAS